MVQGTNDVDLRASFRVKANYMKTWKPGSTPSNRDRLELYALHKQSVSGDAPGSLPKQTQEKSSPAEKAKYNAWRSKSGLSQSEAMRSYIQESERQIRVYGGGAPPPTTTTTTAISNNANNTNTTTGEGTVQRQQGGSNHYNNDNNNGTTTRGLAAIPLLCAAASESRTAYLHRLANTEVSNSWWSRQEPLCAPPGSIWSLPEYGLISIAGVAERLSLLCNNMHTNNAANMVAGIVPATSIQSFLWPTHNCLLSLWMGNIVVLTAYTCVLEYVGTLLFGARRTGKPLRQIQDKIQLSSDSIATMTEIHQPLSARMVGLALLPYCTIVRFLSTFTQQFLPGYFNSSLLFAAIYISILSIWTWWYWLLVCPWLAACLLGMALLSGNCFALIDMAGV